MEHTMVSIQERNGSLTVRAPYHPDFPSRAKRLTGRWNPAEQVWTFDPRTEPEVRELCTAIYGTDGTPTATVTVRAIAARQVAEFREPVTLYGRVLARARGRDSGAKLGEGVVLVKGRICSGGSARHWKTIVEEGTEFVVYDVPATMVQPEDPPEGWRVFVEDPDGGKQALRQERERLLRRIAEIDAILGDGTTPDAEMP